MGTFEGAARRLGLDRRTVKAKVDAGFVERIRSDEEIHVDSLRLYLGELRELTLKNVTGGTVPGSELIDRFWSGLVEWATVEQPAIAAKNQYEVLKPAILEHADGERVLRDFDALGDVHAAASAG